MENPIDRKQTQNWNYYLLKDDICRLDLMIFAQNVFYKLNHYFPCPGVHMQSSVTFRELCTNKCEMLLHMVRIAHANESSSYIVASPIVLRPPSSNHSDISREGDAVVLDLNRFLKITHEAPTIASVSRLTHDYKFI
jgi:hypothetical protein